MFVHCVFVCEPVCVCVCYAGAKSNLCVCVCVCVRVIVCMRPGENVTTLICLAPVLLCVGTFLPFTQTMSNTCPQESVAIQTTSGGQDY